MLCRAYLIKSWAAKRAVLVGYLRQFQAVKEATGAKKWKYVLDNTELCQEAFCRLLGISEIPADCLQLGKDSSANLPQHGNLVGWIPAPYAMNAVGVDGALACVVPMMRIIFPTQE